MRWPLTVVFFLLAGCLGGSTPQGNGADAADDGRTSRMGAAINETNGGHYGGSAALTIDPQTGVSVTVGGVAQNTNCMLFWDVKGADYAIDNVTATLTWTAATPLAEQLELFLTDADQDKAITGRSPVVMTLHNVHPSPANWGLGFGVDEPAGSFGVNQPVKLDLAFDYTGHLPQPGFGQCSNTL